MMMKRIIITTTTFLCLIFGIHVYASPIISQEDYIQKMNAHIEKMKIKNPIKYEEMVKRAGGNITHCCSCHVESCAGNLPTQQLPTLQPPTPQSPTPQRPKKM